MNFGRQQKEYAQLSAIELIHMTNQCLSDFIGNNRLNLFHLFDNLILWRIWRAYILRKPVTRMQFVFFQIVKFQLPFLCGAACYDKQNAFVRSIWKAVTTF